LNRIKLEILHLKGIIKHTQKDIKTTLQGIGSVHVNKLLVMNKLPMTTLNNR